MNSLKLSNLDKIYWPEENYTKKDLIDYYVEIQDFILPHLKNRPVSMNRFPDGIYGKHFYQKDTGNLNLPDWVPTICVNGTSYILCQNAEVLIYIANLGSIEINVWNSRASNLDHPDFLVLDLDPVEIGFEVVVETAQHLKTVLDEIGLTAFIKTSGMSGLHIYVPTGGEYDYEQLKQLAKLIAAVAHSRFPRFTSIERLEKKRVGKVYIDYLQNNKAQTMAAPYSVRPVQGANVSTPLLWEELNGQLSPNKFNIENVPARLYKIGDPFKEALDCKGFEMESVLTKLKEVIL